MTIPRDESCCCRCRSSIEHVDMLSRGNKKGDKGLEWNGGGSLCATARNDRQSVVARKIAKAYWGSSGKLKSRKTRRFVQSNSLLVFAILLKTEKSVKRAILCTRKYICDCVSSKSRISSRKRFFMFPKTFMTCKWVSWTWCARIYRLKNNYNYPRIIEK